MEQCCPIQNLYLPLYVIAQTLNKINVLIPNPNEKVKNANLPEGNMRNASASAKVKHLLCLFEMLIQS